MSYDFNGDSNKGDDKDRTMMLGLPLGKDGIGALFRRSRSRIASRRMDVLMRCVSYRISLVEIADAPAK